MKGTRKIEFEFARIIACFIVICLHTSSWYISGETIDKSLLLIKCFLQDAVPIFWYIMGFFLFANSSNSFFKLLKKTMLKVFLPAFGMMVFAQIFSPWIYQEKSFLACVQSPAIDFYNLFGNLFQWKSSMTLSGHFWYVFEYIKVILWFPLISKICVPGKTAATCRIYVYVLSFISIILVDIQQLYPLVIGGNLYKVVGYQIISNSLLHVMLGYETYLHREFLYRHAKRICLLGASVFVLFNIQRYFLQYALFESNLKNDYFLHIDSLNSFFSSYGLFLALVLFPIKESRLVNQSILYLSSRTLGIYIVHRCVYEKLNNMGIRDWIYEPANSAKNLGLEFFCMIEYAVIVFLISLCIVYLVSSIVKMLKIFYGGFS